MNKPKSSETSQLSDYTLRSDGRFILEAYDEKKPFSNFLPGIAGLHGIPMWVFFVNRGQGISSFGTKNKDNAILEFFPANKAYQEVGARGFRTFLKIQSKQGKDNQVFYEPFGAKPFFSSEPRRAMEISSDEFLIRETHKALGLRTVVRYFTVPNESLAALVREVSITNLSKNSYSLEMLDGLPSVNPYGMNEFFVKNMSRTIEAWMIVDNWREKKAPFMRLKVDATDRPEVTFIREGNFFFTYLDGEGGPQLLPPVIDPAKVFGHLLDFSRPELFYVKTPFKGFEWQHGENRTPCAFSLASFRLAPGATVRLRSFFGQAPSVERLNEYVAKARDRRYVDKKRLENKAIIEGVKSACFTATASPAYDLYAGQCYLDNVLRGGLPIHFGDEKKSHIFYVYSRKHGDPERDYNRFLVEPTYYSQGDGNYRDVNQNRRDSVWFDPRVRDTDIKTFLDLVQLDGFNPLVVKGTAFRLFRRSRGMKALARYVGGRHAPACADFLSKSFTPGEFYGFLEAGNLLAMDRFGALMSELAPFLGRESRAEHGEGFWVDHWTYNLDLIESYLAVFPEKKADLLFRRADFVFYDNDHRVLSRAEKYFLNKKTGVVRQYRAVVKDPAKAEMIAGRRSDAHLVRTRHGRGDVYRTTLFVKMLCLFANKIASLDAHGVGIEMEADKPSWNDSLNGLPGLCGSSISETFELKRLALFLIEALEEAPGKDAWLPAELHRFVRQLHSALEKSIGSSNGHKSLRFWEAAGDARESYRASTFYGLSGKKERFSFAQAKEFLEHAREKVQMGLERARALDGGVYPTYFKNEVTRHALVRVKKKAAKAGEKEKSDWAPVKPVEFRQVPMPLFLEGPVHALKVEREPERKKALLRAVRASGLYDKKLGMYKISASLLGESQEIGRARTFTPGWLENESVWLHMEYKFLLEILKSGLADEFFEDFTKALIPFQPAERYGRSILENSSFLSSSAYFDESCHGTGFVARLSGSTAEFLSLWLLMNVGKKPFSIGNDGKLSLHFDPSLPAWLFTKEESVRTFHSAEGKESRLVLPRNAAAFLFLGKTIVVYHNPKRLNTYGRLRASVKKISLSGPRTEKAEFKGDRVPSPYAVKVRDGQVPRIDIELG